MGELPKPASSISFLYWFSTGLSCRELECSVRGAVPLSAAQGIGGSLWLSVIFGSTLCVFSVPAGSGCPPPGLSFSVLLTKMQKILVEEMCESSFWLFKKSVSNKQVPFFRKLVNTIV